MDAEDVLVDYGREGDAVEDLVRFFPDAVADFFAEALAALVDVTAFAVVLRGEKEGDKGLKGVYTYRKGEC